MFDYSKPATVPVFETATGYRVDGVDITEPIAVSFFRDQRARGKLYLALDPFAESFARAQDAVQRGDRVAAARHMIAALSSFLPMCGVKKLPADDLSDMGQRDGAAAAAQSAAGVLGNAPPSPERDATVADLKRLGTEAEVCDILRDGFQQFDRQSGANELVFLPILRNQVEAVVTANQPQIATDPLVRRDLEPATQFLTGAAQKAAETRRRNKNERDEMTKQITAQVEGAARAEGRSEARAEINDTLAALLKK